MESVRNTEVRPDALASERDRAWFPEAHYGLFLHWGLYSILGRGEWARNREQIPADEYHALADIFTGDGFNAREWAAFAAASGMRYAVLTTKHHDGFCLWNSKVCLFNSVNSAAKRDFVAEFVEAFRAEGLRVGLYYSLGDWDQPDWSRAVHGDVAAQVRFAETTRAMVEELVTQYGKIDVMWYDLPQGLSAAQWRARELNAMVRQHQPGILINNRSMLAEDFSISEQNSNAPSMGRMWEACTTLNESWAYVDGDKDFKTPRQVARTLAKISSNGGNLLLNVGPDAAGRIPPESREIVERVGEWLERNREAIEAKPIDRLPFNLWGSTLAAENRMYLFLERYFGCELRIGGLVPNVTGAKILSYPGELSWDRRGDQTIIRGLPKEDPDEILTVLRLDLDGPPDQEISRVISGADIMARFPD